MFTARDHRQLEERGMDPAVVARQVELLRNPPRPIALERPATRGDGIRRIAAAEYATLESAAARAAHAGRLMAFVPASGAATRMFTDLRAALDSGAPGQTEAGRRFFESIEWFPFAQELRARAGSLDPRTPADQARILEALLDGLAYAETPKGLIPFHRAGDGFRTPFEEHLLQARRYLRAADGTVRAHFTVAAGHMAEFERALETIRPRIEEDGSRLAVGFSVQHRSTDAVALDPSSGEPFRASDGSLLLRPSGHGALLRNLEACGAEIASIRNIDNVVRDEASEDVVRWKRILIGALAGLQSEIFAILGEIDRGAGEPALDRAIALARESFRRVPEGPLKSVEEKRAFVRAALDRPLRVCGVVVNEGEPGGAPFWVSGPGGASLQIVESAQVDLRDAEQKKIWDAATHFNPVDVIAALRRRDGTPYRLADFVDPGTVLVAKKSHEGRELLALELPGLWNGAMAGWNTVFVEVPAATFAPVKTVFDLLRPAHR